MTPDMCGMKNVKRRSSRNAASVNLIQLRERSFQLENVAKTVLLRILAELLPSINLQIRTIEVTLIRLRSN